MYDPNDPKFIKEMEDKKRLFYDSVILLRDDANFKVFLERIEELAEQTKQDLTECKTMEDVVKLQTYYHYLQDLFGVAYEQEPNPTPPTDE